MDFIIEEGELKAYVGSPKIKKLVIPEGVEVIGKGFMQEAIKNLEIFIPASCTYIEKGAFSGCVDAKSITFAPKSELESLLDCPRGLKYLKVPESVTEFSTGSNGKVDIVVLSKKTKVYDDANVQHLFLDYSVSDSWFTTIKGACFVYENWSYEGTEYVDDIKTTGLSYVKNSEKVVIVDIDNSVAKLDDMPKKVDGKNVAAINLINHLADNRWSGVNLQEKLGDLYAREKYQAGQIQKKTDEIVREFHQRKDWDVKDVIKRTKTYTPWQTEENNAKAEYEDCKSSKSKIVFMVIGVLALVLGLVWMFMPVEVDVWIMGIIALVVAVVFLTLSIVKFAKMAKWRKKYEKIKAENAARTDKTELCSSFVAACASRLPYGYVYAAIKAIDYKFIDLREFGPITKSGARMAIRSLGGSTTYNVYDTDGHKIGEIDKK